MQMFARRAECKHIVWAGPLTDTRAVLNVADELRGRSCPTCGEIVREVDFVAIKKPTATFDEPPAPRNAENKLEGASNADVRKTRQRLAGLGAQTGGLAADLKEAALGLTPPRWRGALEKIPVGILRTYEPNAECIRFKDSAVPAIVFHQGLAGYLFKMNRSVFPLLRMGSMSEGAISRFVDNEKNRSALRVQAVDAALEFLGVGTPRSKVLVEIPMVARLLEMPLTRTMSAFLLCHEYGHAVLNHADELRSVGRDSKFYLLERSRAMEFEADTWGQDAVIGAFTGGENLEPSLAMLDDLFPGGAPEVKQDSVLTSRPVHCPGGCQYARQHGSVSWDSRIEGRSSSSAHVTDVRAARGSPAGRAAKQRSSRMVSPRPGASFLLRPAILDRRRCVRRPAGPAPP